MTMTSPAPAPPLDGTLDGIARQLGMTRSAVQTALKQGFSVTDLAWQQGVWRRSLVEAVQNQIQRKRLAQGLPPADQATLDRMVNRAFDRRSRPPARAASQSGDVPADNQL